MTAIQINLVTPKDIEALARLFDLYRQFYQQPSNLTLAKTYLQTLIQQDQSAILLAKVSDKAVGFTQLYPTFCSIAAAPIFVLYDLFVDEPYRTLGVGEELMRAAEQEGKLRGAVRLDLSTARNNHAAQRLYRRLGWVEDTQFLTFSKSLS